MKALITGIRGQDGSYLAELLRAKGYEVVGTSRTEGALSRERVTQLVSQKFDEIYNLASVATVAKPWEDPAGTVEIAGMVPLYFLEAIHAHAPATKFFQASSAEMYGDPQQSPQSETTPLAPRSPYGWGKLLAHEAVEAYRNMHNVFAVSGILFNHESPRRRPEFITRKITKTLFEISQGKAQELVVGNLESRRDWAAAQDIVEAMWMTLQAPHAGSFIMASGQTHSVRELIEEAAHCLGMQIAWEGQNEQEVGRDAQGVVRVRVSKDFYRPVETKERRGDISKIKQQIGWQPKTSFKQLVKEMVEAEGK